MVYIIYIISNLNNLNITDNSKNTKSINDHNINVKLDNKVTKSNEIYDYKENNIEQKKKNRHLESDKKDDLNDRYKKIVIIYQRIIHLNLD